MAVRNWKRQFAEFRRNLPKDVRSDFDASLSLFLKHDRKTKLGSYKDARDKQKRRNAKKEASRKRAAILEAVYRRGKRRTITDPEILLYRPKIDPLRDSLSPGFVRKYRSLISRRKFGLHASIDLEDFSFARNPRGTLANLRQIIRLSATHEDIRLNFVDENCDDVAPYMVLNHLFRTLPPVISGGTIKPEVVAVIESVGLDRALGMGRIHGPRLSNQFILPFRMVHRLPPGFFGDRDHQLRPQFKELVADRFCDALSDWLDASGYELTPAGAALITTSITEALDNAERHGHPDIDDGMGDWTMAGFSRLVEDDDGWQRLECSVSIVSVGSTIDQSLSTADTFVAQRIDDYVGATKRKTDASIEVLRTVAALQDGVTRVPSASAERRGGMGLLSLVDFFADLGDTDKPERASMFTIVSGNSCLRITAPYRRGIVNSDTKLRELWLNAENDGKKPPDANHAYRLEDRFSGTILSACFSIDREYLTRKFAA